MSEEFLRIIPTIPNFVPLLFDQGEITQLLFSFGERNISFRTAKQVQFIDCGNRLERINCPFCESSLDVSWWQEAMDYAYQKDFTDLEVVLPCCGNITSLNNLIYFWPCGFARFVIEIREPAKDIDQKQLKMIEEILQTRLAIVKAHY